MGDTISVGKPAHLTSDQVVAEVNDREGRREISDACAVTIASWWASSSVYDAPFTALATTGTVEYQELSDAIYRVRQTVRTGSFRARALDMLGTWAISRIITCAQCELPVRLIDGEWVVTDTDTTADGLSYCPPDPDAPSVGRHRVAR